MIVLLKGGGNQLLKKERQNNILNLCETRGIVTVRMIMEQLGVSDMTVRRDLIELEKKNKLIRTHGGAHSINYVQDEKKKMRQLDDLKESSDQEKKSISMQKKRYIAKKAASLIDNEQETIFLGAGTTIELMTEFILLEKIRVITNSLEVFKLLKHKSNFDLYLIGGSYQADTGAFVGSITDEMIRKIGISKTFVGVNGLKDNWVSTFNIEEGKIQRIALDQAVEKYLVVSADKFNHSEFFNFYDLKKIDALFTDYTLSSHLKNQYERYTKILN